MYTGEEIEQLSHTELLELIWEYDNYIQNCNNSNEQPVSLSEFYEYEYPLNKYIRNVEDGGVPNNEMGSSC